MSVGEVIRQREIRVDNHHIDSKSLASYGVFAPTLDTRDLFRRCGGLIRLSTGHAGAGFKGNCDARLAFCKVGDQLANVNQRRKQEHAGLAVYCPGAMWPL